MRDLYGVMRRLASDGEAWGIRSHALAERVVEPFSMLMQIESVAGADTREGWGVYPLHRVDTTEARAADYERVREEARAWLTEHPKPKPKPKPKPNHWRAEGKAEARKKLWSRIEVYSDVVASATDPGTDIVLDTTIPSEDCEAAIDAFGAACVGEVAVWLRSIGSVALAEAIERGDHLVNPRPGKPPQQDALEDGHQHDPAKG